LSNALSLIQVIPALNEHLFKYNPLLANYANSVRGIILKPPNIILCLLSKFNCCESDVNLVLFLSLSLYIYIYILVYRPAASHWQTLSHNVVHLPLRFADRHDITEILLKVALSTMKQSSVMLKYFMFSAVLW
jgi:hypothetical protein